MSKIKKQKSKLLLGLIENVPARFNPKPDENYRYVELTNINSSIGVIDGFSEVWGERGAGSR